MNVKDTVLTLFTNNFDETIKEDRLPSIIASVAPKMREICGSELYKEYKSLSPDNTASSADSYISGVLTLTIGKHSFVTGDYVYLTGENVSYNGLCLISSATSTSISLFYSFDGITVPETFPADIPEVDGVYVTSSKKHDLITAEAYLVLYYITILFEEIRNYTPYSSSTDFGEGEITSVSYSTMQSKRNGFMSEARQIIGKYYITDDDTSFSVNFGSLKGDNTWQTS